MYYANWTFYKCFFFFVFFIIIISSITVAENPNLRIKMQCYGTIQSGFAYLEKTSGIIVLKPQLSSLYISTESWLSYTLTPWSYQTVGIIA